MKPLALFLLLVAAAHAATGIHVFRWQESRNEKTGEKQFAFFIAPQAVQEMFEADARGNQKAAEALGAKSPQDAWDYALMLSGEMKSYSREKITLMVPGPCGQVIKISSGSVEVDREKNTVRIALKVENEGKVVTFVGNGVYPIQKKPNRVAGSN